MVDIATEQIKSQTLTYIQDELVDDSDIVIEYDTDLIMGGVIDSLDIIHLITFLQNEFNIQIPPMDVTVDHFSTIDTIATYIQQSS